MARLNTRSRPSLSPFRFDQSDGSDKENRGASSRRQTTRKSVAVNMSTPESSSSNKRRKVDDRRQNQPSQSARRKVLSQKGDTRFYDPDQPKDVRRATKRGLRDLHAEFTDSRSEYLNADSRGIQETLTQANNLYTNVKHPSDATVDSRLLVEAADLSYKKVNDLTLGDSSVGLDVDDLLTRCIAFMRRADRLDDARRNTQAPSSTQTQRRRRQQAEHDDDEEDDNGVALNWEYLGRNACFPYNSRPCLSGFLLGPLSVQKKQRQQTQRRAREARQEPSQAVRLTQMRDEDLEKQESANLTVICGAISTLLGKTQAEGQENLRVEYENMPDDVSDEDMARAMRKHHVSDDGGVPFLDFCINPLSFGQSVENIFYVSFLIKEGRAGLNLDTRNMPTLFHQAGTRDMAARQETERNQAIISLDYDMWEAIIRDAGITKSIIPHRTPEVWEDGRIDIQPTSRIQPPALMNGEENEDDDVEEDDDMYN